MIVALSILVTCGIAFLVFWLMRNIPGRLRNDISKLSLVIIVKNQQDIVEGLVRNFFRGDFLRRVAPDMKITVIDMSSSDETWEILTRLSQIYDYLEILKESEKEKVFTYFQQ